MVFAVLFNLNHIQDGGGDFLEMVLVSAIPNEYFKKYRSSGDELNFNRSTKNFTNRK